MAKVWIGKARLFGTLVRGLNQPATRGLTQPLGEEVTIRIISGEGGLSVDQQDGADGLGFPRWVKSQPRLFTQDSLLAAIVDAAGLSVVEPSPAEKEG